MNEKGREFFKKEKTSEREEGTEMTHVLLHTDSIIREGERKTRERDTHVEVFSFFDFRF